jgi:urease accessory protein
MTSTWLLLQLADGAFPAGGFAHSGGLEAAWQYGAIDHFARYVDQSLWRTGFGALPFARAGALTSVALGDIDAACDAFLTNHVSNRASRAQGRAFFSTACHVFRAPLAALAERANVTHMHCAPLFGAVGSALGLSCADVQILLLHSSLRGTLSAAVRLGIVGPLEAQRMQGERATLLDQVLRECGSLEMDEAAQTAPMSELFAALHDRLYTRLFQS